MSLLLVIILSFEENCVPTTSLKPGATAKTPALEPSLGHFNCFNYKLFLNVPNKVKETKALNIYSIIFWQMKTLYTNLGHLVDKIITYIIIHLLYQFSYSFL